MLSCYQHGMPNQRSPITEASFFVYFGLFGHFPLYHGRGLFVNLFHPSKKSPFFMQNIPKFRRFLIVLIALNYCHSIKIKKKTPFGVFFSYLNLAFSCFFLLFLDNTTRIQYTKSVGFFRQEGGGTRGIHHLIRSFCFGICSWLLHLQVV